MPDARYLVCTVPVDYLKKMYRLLILFKLPLRWTDDLVDVAVRNWIAMIQTCQKWKDLEEHSVLSGEVIATVAFQKLSWE